MSDSQHRLCRSRGENDPDTYNLSLAYLSTDIRSLLQLPEVEALRERMREVRVGEGERVLEGILDGHVRHGALLCRRAA